MAVDATGWLDLVQREYLSRFVPGGGSAVKFVVADDAMLGNLGERLEAMARERRLQFVAVNTASTKLHMIQDVFFAIAREIDWEVLAQRWVEAVFRRHQYEWSTPGKAVPIRELAHTNKVADTLLSRQVYQWLTEYIMRDREMAQDFRAAMTYLCMRRMEMADDRAAAPVIDWLRGDLRQLAPFVRYRSIPELRGTTVERCCAPCAGGFACRAARAWRLRWTFGKSDEPRQHVRASCATRRQPFWTGSRCSAS